MSGTLMPRGKRCGARCANSSATALCKGYPMAKNRGRLQLVSSHDPSHIFDDLDALCRAQGAPTKPTIQRKRRPRLAETFARIPHDRARRLYRLSGAAWALLIELDRLIFEGHGCNPVRLTTKSLKASGLT